jgi:type I restriction enzyme S subunit
MSKAFASDQETKMQREADSVAVLLERYFDTAFSAPGGIKKLRELILALAMRGKLVPQDPNDPSACELLKEIEAEKKRLVKEGKIKGAKPLSKIKSEEVPHELPQGWEQVKLPECYFGIGNKKNQIQTKDYLETGRFPVIDQGKNFSAGYCNDEGKLLITDRSVIVFGDHTKIVKFVDFNFIIGADGVKILCPYRAVFPKFLFYQIQSYALSDRGYARHFKVLNEKSVMLPPLPEQQRIVSKIDQLMARCDELEKLRAEREQMRLAIHTSAIRQLLAVPGERQNGRSTEKQDSNTRTALPAGQAAQFVARHFGELYTVKENVAELRKAILQLAVMGKLVPQDPNDPPASELLKEIETKIQRSIKERNIKKTKPTLKIASDEIPFQIPEEWQWVRLSSISESIDYGTSQKTCGDSSLVPVYRMGNIVEGQLLADGLKYIPPDIDDLPRLYLKSNDILFNRTNSYELVGKSAIYFGPDNCATFASYLIRIRLFKNKLLPIFFGIAMNAPYFRTTQIEPEIVQQCGQANFNGTKLSLCLVPLPPLPEQHRIVAKVDQLISLCDALEQQIAAATAKQTELLDAMMSQI